MNARWLWIALVGGLAAAQWGLFMSAGAQRASAGRTEEWKPAERARVETRREVLATAEAIALHRRIERYATAAVTAHRSGRVVDVGPAESSSRYAPGDQLETANTRARAQLERWAMDSPRVAVGFYLPEVDEGWPEGVARPSGMIARGRIVTGTLDDGSPYCIQLGTVRRANAVGADSRPEQLPWALDGDAATGPGAFGACWLYARYGLPGPAVGGWMERTGTEAAIATTAEGIWSEPLDRVEDRMWLAMGARRSMSLVGGTHARAELCADGVLEACAALFRHPTASPTGFTELDRFDGTFSYAPSANALAPGTLPLVFSWNPLGEDWLFRLEREHGAERMAAFWTSGDADVAAAFEAAFGLDPAVAVMDEVRARIGTGPTGPTVPAWGWIGLLAALVTGLVLGGAMADRRRIA